MAEMEDRRTEDRGQKPEINVKDELRNSKDRDQMSDVREKRGASYSV